MMTLRESVHEIDWCLDPSLVLYVPLHHRDGASFMSRDHYGHLCTVTGALWTPEGRSFDGTDDYINCGDDTNLDITVAITLEAWVNTNAAATLQVIIVRDDGTNRNYALIITVGTFAFDIWISNVHHGVSRGLAIAGTWFYLAGTFDGANMYQYVNGIAGSPVAAVGAIDNDNVSCTIGIRATLLDRDFNGLIGEVRIYNRALTPIEIKNNYLATRWRYQ